MVETNGVLFGRSVLESIPFPSLLLTVSSSFSHCFESFIVVLSVDMSGRRIAATETEFAESRRRSRVGERGSNDFESRTECETL